ncbi:MAG: nucleotide pyrophosphohydrolase [Verrucomicrobia bacterium]|nr:nucleotide pyrophosphohydrolase [Verrucomicrobiota bacterium]
MLKEDRLKMFLQKLHSFYEERDWKQFHSPKNISMGVASEAGELVQIFRFLTESESAQLNPKLLELVRDEIGDIFIFLSYLADILGIDVIEAAQDKLAQAAKKYPAELCRGIKDKV